MLVKFSSSWTYRGEVEHHREDVDKACDRQVHPLHASECLLPFSNVGEEDVRSEYRRHHGSNAVESLRNVDAQFGILGRTAYSDY